MAAGDFDPDLFRLDPDARPADVDRLERLHFDAEQLRLRWLNATRPADRCELGYQLGWAYRELSVLHTTAAKRLDPPYRDTLPGWDPDAD